VLLGDVAEVAEENIRETCKDQDIEVIDMAVNVGHVHLFFKYPPKYSVSRIAKWIKWKSSKLLRADRFPQLKGWLSGAFVSAIVLSINPFRKSVYGQKVLEQGWEVVENDI
jgi:REP element-mobilizing transposase RayT